MMTPTDPRIEAILAASDTDSCEQQKMDLLRDFHRGRPVRDLVPLLHGENKNAAEIGIWIASELGPIGKPLLPDILPLLHHADRVVRFFAVDCVLEWATGNDGAALASAVFLVEDHDSAVRWKAMRFLARASREQLLAAQSQPGSFEGAPGQASALRWLLGEEAQDPASIMAQLRNPDPLLRRYAVVAAARLPQPDRTALIEASASKEADLKDFATDTLSAL